MRAEAEAPCTVGNFGPGFDVLSLALDKRGDTVTIEDASRDEIEISGAGAQRIPKDWARNAASAAIDALRAATGKTQPLRLHVHKGVRPGSGLGSSASSSAAAVLAFARFHALALRVDQALDAAGAGEAAATGSAHYDDVAAALYGGLTVVGGAGADRVVRLTPPSKLQLAIMLPEQQLDTRDMRARIPQSLPRADVVANLSCVARIVHACHADDEAMLARALDDRISKPYRKGAIARFDDAERAARESGASAFVLCGSGPAMLAVAPRGVSPEKIILSVQGRFDKEPLDAFVARPAKAVNDPALPLP